MTRFTLPPAPPFPTVGRWDVPVRDDNNTALLARVSREAPRVPWDVFIRDHFATHNEAGWKRGEHVALIGPTGQGKTTLLLNILNVHPYVTVFATKPRDTSMDRLIQHGYVRMDTWQSIPAKRAPRRVLWPSAMELDSEERQHDVFHDAFRRIYREGGWTVAIDEGWYMTNELGLRRDIMLYLLQARSLGISLVLATQRPAWVPVEVYDQSTHLFFWRDNDERNLSRISGISWRSADMIRYLIANLDRYQVLYINTRTGAMLRTRAPAPQPASTGRR